MADVAFALVGVTRSEKYVKGVWAKQSYKYSQLRSKFIIFIELAEVIPNSFPRDQFEIFID